jgi:hypothetical protein
MRGPDFSVLWSGPQCLAWFLLGVFTPQIWQYIKVRWLDWRHPEEKPHGVRVFNFFWISVIVVAVVMLWVSIRTEQTYECQQKVNNILAQWVRINGENDKAFMEQQDAQTQWMHDLIFPPSDIAILNPNDPRRVAWGIMRTNQVYDIIHENQVKLKVNIAIREAHPIPDAKCERH